MKFIRSGMKLPVEVVFSPEWWHKHTGICFDRDFFFNPECRVESEQKMENVLYEKWGRFGLGEHRHTPRPEVGPVHLASGFMLSEMLGCKIQYSANHPPQVIPAGFDKCELGTENVWQTEVFKDFSNLVEKLRMKFGYVSGDVNWSGILNIALDLRGQDIFLDMLDMPDKATAFFNGIAGVLEFFTSEVQLLTGTTSITVNRTVRHFPRPVLLHSECSLTMISADDYRRFLRPIDIKWSCTENLFGIHYCGGDPQRFGQAFAEIPSLSFLDAGSGGDIAALRKYLPETFLNIRISAVDLRNMTKDQIASSITEKVKQSGDPQLTGVCCVNIDDGVSDDKIDAIFDTVAELRKQDFNLKNKEEKK